MSACTGNTKEQTVNASMVKCARPHAGGRYRGLKGHPLQDYVNRSFNHDADQRWDSQ